MRKKGKHELSKGGNARKTLARSVNLTGARALSTGWEDSEKEGNF